MTTRNPAIGTCPCPIPSCKETCTVSKFASRHQRDSARRWAGKLYIDCPRHGRLGIDAKDDMQDWILKNATIPRPGDAAPAASPPVPAASTPPRSPLPVPDGDEPDDDEPHEPKQKGGFGFFS